MAGRNHLLIRNRRLIGVVAGLLAGAVLVGIGAYVLGATLEDKINGAVPTASLFPTDTAGTGQVGTDGTGAPGLAPDPAPSPTPAPGSDITGPLNFLIIGEDSRSNHIDPPHNDANMILHVSADLRSAYLVSLPRDLLVDIPAYQPSGTGARHEKLTHAMSYGSRLGGGKWDTTQGFGLVSLAISGYTGIKNSEFDAGVLFDFVGMTDFVDAIGGVDIYIDEYTRSVHRQPNGKYRTSCPGCLHGYSGPQMIYEKGMMHLSGWQALDYARQRYGLVGVAYGRDRHQRQLVVAVMRQLFSAGMVFDPARADAVLAAVGQGVVFDGRGRSVTEYAYALRRLRPKAVTLIGLPGGGVFSDGRYLGESLNQKVSDSFFAALRADSLDRWVVANPQYVNDSHVLAKPSPGDEPDPALTQPT